MDNNYVPLNYEDLSDHYIMGHRDPSSGKCGDSLGKMLIRSFLPHSDEDVRKEILQEVFLRLMDKDMLKVFDPTKANFGGVIFFTTRTVCVNYLSRSTRNPLTGLNAGSLSEKVTEEEFEPGVYNLDALFSTDTPHYEEALDARNLVGKVRRALSHRAEHPGNKRDRSLLPMLEMMNLGMDSKEMATGLGVTPSTIYNWGSYLRELVTELQAA
jgi:DNA-directed RNA polymerase specialized sigma24 family protein